MKLIEREKLIVCLRLHLTTITLRNTESVENKEAAIFMVLFLIVDIEELFNYISSAGYPTEQVTVKEIKKKYGLRV